MNKEPDHPRKQSPAELFAKTKPTPQPNRRKASIHPNNRLTELRHELGLTLDDVTAGIQPIRALSTSTIFHAEAGYEVVLSTAKALAKFYGRSIEEIWYE